MRIIVPALLIVAGIRYLWAGFKGETFFYPSLGNRPDRESPMPQEQGRILATVLGLGFLFVAIWGLLHQK